MWVGLEVEKQAFIKTLTFCKMSEADDCHT